MSHQSKIVLAQAACLIVSLCHSTYGLPKPSNLHTFKKIYIPGEDFGQNVLAASEYEQMRAALQQELGSVGFTIVDDASAADATLRGGRGEIIILHAPQPDPPRYSYAFLLTSSQGNVVWKTEFEIGSRAPGAEINRRAARKIAGRLFDAWRKSAKKAGVIVKDKVACHVDAEQTRGADAP